ncbi:MAG: glutamine--fructose-6-phosphate transaminase (isomerizing) [Acidobacteriota bacterium]
MCGIVGYVGDRPATEILLNGLKRLEYRGYDSAGIAVVRDHELSTLKLPGKVGQLVEATKRGWDEGLRTTARIGLAHTRWATHGVPSLENAHPHLDQSGRIALVHNGIIENYAEIRKQLLARGHRFLSETDTEVLAHLVGACYQGDLPLAVCAALKQIQGAFGIVVLCADEPDTLVVARRGSPIVVGVGEGESIVASDAAAILAHTNQVIYLDDDDVAVVRADSIDIHTIDRVPVSREIAQLDWDASGAEKGEFEHFMLKEIFEQPDALRNTTRGRIDLSLGSAKLAGLALTPHELAHVGRLTVVACGTSLYAGMVGEYYFEELADLPTDVEQAAEFRYRNPIVSASDMVLAVSQSGETADTLAAVREAQQKGALVAGLCNVVGSTIARETGRGIYLHAGPEIGVASTKAFTCQVAVLLMMALKVGRGRRLSRETGLEICQEIRNLPEIVQQVLDRNEEIARAAEAFAQAEDAFFIGRGILYPVALEGALKLKEISYIHAEGYHAAELKHGPIALLEERVPVVALANDVPGKEKTVGNIEECRARGAPVLAIATEGDDGLDGLANHVLRVPRTSALIAPIPTAVVLQLFAYHIARLRGREIDQPRNLAKSVTVE